MSSITTHEPPSVCVHPHQYSAAGVCSMNMCMCMYKNSCIYMYLLLSGQSMHSQNKHTLACETIEAELRTMRQRAAPAELAQRAKAGSLFVGVLHDRHNRCIVCICTATHISFSCMDVPNPDNRYIRRIG